MIGSIFFFSLFRILEGRGGLVQMQCNVFLSTDRPFDCGLFRLPDTYKKLTADVTGKGHLSILGT
jgi:hypothetical protein